MAQKKNNDSPKVDYKEFMTDKDPKKDILDCWKYYLIGSNKQIDVTEILEERISEFTKREDSEKRNELLDIINQIVLWKVHRAVSINDSVLSKLMDPIFDEGISPDNSGAASIEEIDAWWKKKENKLFAESVLKEMLNPPGNGIRLPMASTILHFLHPNTFLIIDQRSYRVATSSCNPNKEPSHYELTYTNDNAWDIYLEYMNNCIKYYRENNLKEAKIPFRELDRYTYQLDKEIGNKVSY